MLRTRFRPAVALLVAALLAVGLDIAAPGVAMAANPIITDRFVADPSAHVFDGRMYVYATDDETNSGTYWDSKGWRAYSSTDLVGWTDHGEVFAVPSGFSWAQGLAWAPAAASKDGWYYLYLPVDRTKIGVARSRSPSSGFVDARGTPLIDNARDAGAGAEPIDPFVLTDHDGRSYLYFGTRVPKVVELGPDMISTVGPIRDLPVSGGNYAEAPWVHERAGTYYFSYSTGWPGQIAYATGPGPLGPFTYRGIVLDYTNVSTNHQSIVEYGGRWYIVYHRNGRAGGGNHRRSLAMEYLEHAADGTIRPVTQTGSGVGGPQYVTLEARHSGKAVDVAAGAPELIQYTRHGGLNQQWQLIDAGAGFATVVSRSSGGCLDVSGAGTADGTPVLQWRCGTGPHQQWELRDVGDAYVQLVARHSGKCLQVSGASTADGARLVQATCSDAPGQQWRRAPA